MKYFPCIILLRKLQYTFWKILRIQCSRRLINESINFTTKEIYKFLQCECDTQFFCFLFLTNTTIYTDSKIYMLYHRAAPEFLLSALYKDWRGMVVPRFMVLEIHSLILHNSTSHSSADFPFQFEANTIGNVKPASV